MNQGLVWYISTKHEPVYLEWLELWAAGELPLSRNTDGPEAVFVRALYDWVNEHYPHIIVAWMMSQ